MEVTSHSNLKLSPFPLHSRPSEDSDANGNKKIFPSGTNMVGFLSSIYPLRTPIVDIPIRAGFTVRDANQKVYKPAIEDPYFIGSSKGIAEAHKAMLEYIATLNQSAKQLGFQITSDKDRKTDFPDLKSFTDDFLNPNSKSLIDSVDKWEVYNVAGNIDIAQKFNIIRRVLPGWFAVSYAAVDVKPTPAVLASISVLTKAMLHISNSPYFKDKIYPQVLKSQGMPLDTGVGSPYFQAEYKDGMPLSKIKVINDFAGISSNILDQPETLVDAIKYRLKDSPLRDYPFAFQPIRRSQYGYKWQHVWDPSQTGFQLRHDERGHNSTRVAWGPPYYMNLMLSPIQAYLKAMRYCIPGLMHDGDTKRDYLGKLVNYNGYIIENDYSNYDRSISRPIVFEFWKQCFGHLPNSSRILNLLHATVEQATLLMPSQFGDSSSALAVNPERVGLLSGLFDTSERGSFYNAIMCIASILQSGIMSQQDMFDYLTSIVRTGSTKSKNEDIPLFLVQSDDTLLLLKNRKDMSVLVKAFVHTTQAVGLKSEPLVGDRFLMRHMAQGKDSPVAARMLQNTISSEDSKVDPLIVATGLLSRSDGVAGHRTVDAFGLGHQLKIGEHELILQRKAFDLIHRLYENNAIAKPSSITMAINVINGSLTRANIRDGASNQDRKEMDKTRVVINQQLAIQELQEMETKGESDSDVIRDAYRNRFSASGAAFLDFLSHGQPKLGEKITEIGSREEKFLQAALSAMKWPRLIKNL